MAANYIHEDTHATGTLKTEGDVHIGGTFDGQVHSKGCVTISQSGQMNGKIETKTAMIKGSVQGSLEASGDIVLSDSCIIESDVVASTIVVEPGAQVKGYFVITKDQQEREQFKNKRSK